MKPQTFLIFSIAALLFVLGLYVMDCIRYPEMRPFYRSRKQSANWPDTYNNCTLEEWCDPNCEYLTGPSFNGPFYLNDEQRKQLRGEGLTIDGVTWIMNANDVEEQE